METTDVLLQHRSIRKFRDKPINVALLTDIINAGCRASTTGNMQVYSIISTSDRELKQKLAPAHFNQKMVVNAPTILTFCADFNRFNRWCVLNNAKPGYDNFLSFMTAAIDALLVAQNVAVAAESKGLGICYLGTTLYNAETIIDFLHLPKGVVPVTTLVIGWHDESPTLTERLPLKAILHNEVYHDYSDEDISLLYAEKENLPANLKFVAENNKQSLAQVFTDVRYKKHDNECFSEKLLTVLKQQGFM
jgi:nitroreductase